MPQKSSFGDPADPPVAASVGDSSFGDPPDSPNVQTSFGKRVLGHIKDDFGNIIPSIARDPIGTIGRMIQPMSVERLPPVHSLSPFDPLNFPDRPDAARTTADAIEAIPLLLGAPRPAGVSTALDTAAAATRGGAAGGFKAATSPRAVIGAGTAEFLAEHMGLPRGTGAAAVAVPRVAKGIYTGARDAMKPIKLDLPTYGPFGSTGDPLPPPPPAPRATQPLFGHAPMGTTGDVLPPPPTQPTVPTSTTGYAPFGSTGERIPTATTTTRTTPLKLTPPPETPGSLTAGLSARTLQQMKELGITESELSDPKIAQQVKQLDIANRKALQKPPK